MQVRVLKQQNNRFNRITSSLFWRYVEGSEKWYRYGHRCEQYMDDGKLVPDSIIIDLIKERILESDAIHGVMFDGSRTVPQAEALANITEVTHVIAIEVPDERIVESVEGIPAQHVVPYTTTVSTTN